jgi:hypothetical protein
VTTQLLRTSSPTADEILRKLAAVPIKRLRFDDFDPNAIDAALVFFYTGDFDELRVVTGEESSTNTGVTTIATVTGLSPTVTTANTPWLTSSLAPFIPVLHNASTAAVTKVFVTLLHVYDFALRQQLPGLLELVPRKFFALEGYLSRTHLAEVLKVLFEVVPEDDVATGLGLMRSYVRNKEVVMGDEEAVKVLEEREFCAWRLSVEGKDGRDSTEREAVIERRTKETYETDAKRIETLERRNEELKAKHSSTCNEVNALKQRISSLEAEVQALRRQQR